MPIPPGPRLSLKKSLLLLVMITLGFSGTCCLIFLVSHLLEKNHAKSVHYTLSSIVQTRSGGETLPSLFFAEILGLAIDRPVNIYDFDIENATASLEKTHLFQEMSLQKVKPNTLLVDYRLRQPIAYVGGLSNTAFDQEGMLLPGSPFYSPKNLPEIYLNLGEDVAWGEQVEAEKLELVLQLLSLFEPGEVKSIDLTQIGGSSLGTREIILHLKEGSFLRLTPKVYSREIRNYRSLQPHCSGAHIVDLRIPQMAFLKAT